MKFTLSWLRDHLDTNAGLDEITETLTRIGLEVEHVEDQAKTLSAFIVAKVVSAVQHPNADKLRVCIVDIGGDEPVQVVCGAPNARGGMKSVFSPPGTYIPSKKITIAVGEIRGVESRGMLCSAAELELSDDHNGIIDLPTDAPIGMRFSEYAKIGDPVIEINLTPNRPDATSVYGIARDLAAAGLGTLKQSPINAIKGKMPCPVEVRLDFSPDNRKLCPVFALRLIENVKNVPSPDWMQKRLKAIGLRPISALVDITNYITFDRGRPLHVFDADKISGALEVRRSKTGERLLALDGKEYEFDDSAVVIADANGVESIAGIMGGEHSGCTPETTNVLVESALWDPVNIAQTGRRLGVTSDARYRFERGVDPAFNHQGIELATRLILDICGGTPSDVRVEGNIPGVTKCVIFPWSEVKRLTGLDMAEADMRLILERLGFTFSGTGEAATVSVPSWRPDIEGKADIVEEIVRIVGLDHVQNVPLKRIVTISEPVLTTIQRRTRLAKRVLATRGLVEAYTYSFVSRAEAELFGGGQPELSLANPIAADMSDMRPSLLPGLLAASQRNFDRAAYDHALFEVGQVFKGDRPADQKIAAAAIRRGLAGQGGRGRHWSDAAKPAHVFDAKADALALLASLGVSVESMQIVAGAPAWFHPGRSGTMQFGPKSVLGHFGEIHPRVLETLGIDGVVAGFELVLDALPQPKNKTTRLKPKLVASGLQPIRRDFAFVVDAAVRADDILKTARGIDRALVAGATVFDVYEGQGIEPGKKSIGIEITLRQLEKTMTDAEIEAFSAKLVAEVAKKTGGVLRG
ncbi:MAG: phenylalanine--tRNA ligase subunit beta [Beijerinckiaceae bacterium]|nr:phenylalanine--tRNA ligase subunit beta [Beijerinckiaceae bacterium]